jgi:hypothetical protein
VTREKWLDRLSPLGLIVYVLSVTFASIDWILSLEPHWYSAIYGLIVIAGQGLAAMGVAILVLFLLRDDSQEYGHATVDVFQDLGNLLLASVTIWTYLAFSQFLIIWAGNLSEEIPWYLTRLQGGWQWVALSLVLLHFMAPFVALLSSHVKRDPRRLALVASLVLVMHVVDVYWLAMPALRKTLVVHWLDVLALVALGSIWTAASIWRLRGAALQPAVCREEGVKYGAMG